MTPKAALKTALNVLGAEVFRRRRARGWTRKDLAGRAGVSIATLLRLELSQQAPSLTSVSGIASALGVPMGALFTRDGA
jgi:transcriptional regulator with XRE-family HTH domain